MRRWSSTFVSCNSRLESIKEEKRKELGGQEPLASSPRFEVSPSPSCPALFCPQHLSVVSSCGEKQLRITDRKQRLMGRGFHQGTTVTHINNVVLIRLWLHGSPAVRRSICGGGVSLGRTGDELGGVD